MYVRVLEDGMIRISWCEDGSHSDVPTEYVRESDPREDCAEMTRSAENQEQGAEKHIQTQSDHFLSLIFRPRWAIA